MESNANNGQADEDDEVLILNGESSGKRFRRKESNKSIETDYLKSRQRNIKVQLSQMFQGKNSLLRSSETQI
jgi:hypothetical protein